MSVIQSEAYSGHLVDGLSAPKERRCSVCGGELVPPYVAWQDRAWLFICGECCERVESGLALDVATVNFLRRARRLYPEALVKVNYTGSWTKRDS